MDTIEEIRKRRLALGISLGQLARAIGKSDATLSRIERGRIRPSYELVQRILAFLEAQEGSAAPHLTIGDIAHRPLVIIESSALLATAAQRLEGGAYSQLPVVDGHRVVGSLSESALLRALATPDGKRRRVGEVMESPYPMVGEEFPAELLPALFSRYPAVLVVRRGLPDGIATKADLIRGLRGRTFRRGAPP